MTERKVPGVLCVLWVLSIPILVEYLVLTKVGRSRKTEDTRDTWDTRDAGGYFLLRARSRSRRRPNAGRLSAIFAGRKPLCQFKDVMVWPSSSR
jgi:hypothetical protein